jgi:putative ABC transport system permease protein
MLTLSLSRLIAQRFRLVSTSISVFIGIAFLAGSMVLIDTLGESFDDLATDVNQGVDVVVRSSELVESGFAQVRGQLDESVLTVVRGIDGVAEAQPGVEGYAQLVDSQGEAVGNPGQGAPTIGVNWSDSDVLNQVIIAEGRAPREPNEVVIDRYTAENNGFAIGDAVQILLKVPPEDFTITGIGTFGDSDSLMGASLTMFEFSTAQRVLGSEGMINSVSVAAEPGINQDELRDRIAPELPSRAEALTGEASVAELQSDISDALSFFNTFMMIFALIALFVAAFIIYNTFSILVAQRTKETALLRALGAGRRQVVGSVLLEAVLMGLIASALGIVAGIGVAEVLKRLLGVVGFEIPGSNVVFEPSTAYNALIAGVAITAVSAVIPAFRASRTSPLAALREASVDDSALSRSRMVFGLLTLAVCGSMLMAGLFADISNRLVFVGLGAAGIFIGVAAWGPIVARPFARVVGAPLARLRGLPGELAQENGMRNPQRTATTAAALMIGVGLVSAISIFAASTTRTVDKIIDDTVVGDLVIESGSQGFGGLSPALAEEVSALPEVALASGVRMVLTEVDGEGEALLAFETVDMGDLVDVGIIAGNPATLGAEGLAVLDTEAENRGWQLGSEVTLDFVQTGGQIFEVGLIYTEDALVGPMFISNEAYEANSTEIFDMSVYVLSNDDFTTDQFRSAVEAVAAPYPNAEVMDLGELKDSISAQVDQMLTLVYALLALAVIIALIGIANTIALSTVERTREIGLLRAVGMTRPQLRASVRWESFLIALLGTSMGLALGLFFGWSMVEALRDEGITELAIPLPQITIVAVLAAAAGVFASIRPAAKAARLPILDAVASG